MASINMQSILAKAQKCMSKSENQKKVNEIVDKVYLGELGRISFTMSNGGTPHPPDEAAAKFIEVLRNEIDSHASGGGFSSGQLGATAVSALKNLDHGSPYKVGTNTYQIPVYFTSNLHRDSLDIDEFPEGVDNIAALLNSGYTAGHVVYGYWMGHNEYFKTASLTQRAGAHFIDNAVHDFMGNYASEYGIIDIQVDDVYN